MSHKKFFSLLHGNSLHQAPKGKIIPASEVGELLSANELLERARADAEQYRAEVVKEGETIKEQASREGFEAGFSRWIEAIADLEKEVQQVHKALEKSIIPVALKAAQKIVGREIELSETAILDIIANKLKAVAQHKRVTIFVNPEDLQRVEAGRERLKQIFEALEVLSVRARKDVSRGGCVIETEGGIINAQLEQQWEIIERAFQSMTKGTTP